MRVDYYRNAAYFPDTGACAVADVHIGIEDALQAEGFAMPLGEEQELLGRFRDAIGRFEPRSLILDGDVLHEFGRLRPITKKSFDRILRELVAAVDEVVVLKGSHDRMVEAALEGTGITPEASYLQGGVLFTHGDAIPPAAKEDGVRLVVIGHDHPAIDIDLKKEPCYLYGEKAWKGRDVLVLPAFNPLCAGTVINGLESRDFLSPFLRESDVGRYRPIIAAGADVLEFPPLGEFREILGAWPRV